MYYSRGKQRGRLRSECKDCHKQYVSQKNANNREAYHRLKQMMKCEKCGEQRYYLIDFHHIESEEKELTVARQVVKACVKNVIKELKRTIPLCANCHREYHYLSKQNGLSISEYLNKTIEYLKSYWDHIDLTTIFDVS